MEKTKPASYLLLLLFLAALLINPTAAVGDADPVYKTCVDLCEKKGCIRDRCFKSCEFSSGKQIDSTWYSQVPLYLRWKEWDCRSDCRYHCMLDSEEKREKPGGNPLKYHGRWPFHRVLGIQEPVSVVLSTLNLAMQFQGWLSFFILLYYKLPLRANGKTYYEYTWFWHLYGVLAMNSWFWSAVFHGRYVDLTERLYYSSTVVFLGFSLMLSILRALNVRAEAARVMVAAPLIAFVTTHLLFLNLVELDHLLNMAVVMVLVALQLLFCTTWALSRPPSCWKLWLVVVGGTIAAVLEICDFPPYKGVMDTHAVWQAISVPVTCVLWSFVGDDAKFSTSALIKKAK